MLIGLVSLCEVIDAHRFDSALTLLVVVIVAGAAVFAVARRDALLGRLPRTGSERARG